MSTTIYLIRHGEVSNPDQIWYGRLPNFYLSELGKKQIEITANYLLDKNITAIYTSPLIRAKQSGEIIAKKLDSPPIIISQELNEIITSYEGKSLTITNAINDDFYFSPGRKKNDETMEEIATRMKQFVTNAVKKYYGKSIVAVSHGDPCMILSASINQLPF